MESDNANVRITHLGMNLNPITSLKIHFICCHGSSLNYVYLFNSLNITCSWIGLFLVNHTMMFITFEG